MLEHAESPVCLDFAQTAERTEKGAEQEKVRGPKTEGLVRGANTAFCGACLSSLSLGEVLQESAQEGTKRTAWGALSPKR